MGFDDYLALMLKTRGVQPTVTKGQLIADGIIPSYSHWDKMGYNADLNGATEEDIWSAGGTLGFATVNESWSVRSSSTTENVAGAITVRITGCSLDGTPRSETFTINATGTTEVTTALGSVWYRCNSMRIMTGGPATGTIVVRVTGAGAVRNQIEIGGTNDRNASYMVPKGYDLYLTGWQVGAGGNTVDKAFMRVILRSNYDVVTDAIGTVMYPMIEAVVINSNQFFDLSDSPLVFPELTRIRVSGVGNAQTASIAVGTYMYGYLESA